MGRLNIKKKPKKVVEDKSKKNESDNQNSEVEFMIKEDVDEVKPKSNLEKVQFKTIKKAKKDTKSKVCLFFILKFQISNYEDSIFSS
jgi:hypothetical protein